MVGSFVDILQTRFSTHTYIAFVIKKAFDTSWVEATLVLLHEAGVTGQLWACPFPPSHSVQSAIGCTPVGALGRQRHCSG